MKTYKLVLRAIVIIILVAGIGLAFVRITTPEDYWLCQGGQWIKHGNPSEQMPSSGCGPSNATATWKTYLNQKYQFEIKHPELWAEEEYSLTNVTSGKVFEVLLAQPGVKENPSRQIYWQIEVWKKGTSDSKIAKDSGFSNFDVKDVQIDGQTVSQTTESGPVQIKNTVTSTYHLYTIQGPNYIYSLQSRTCQDKQSLDCMGILSSFRLLP
jgi:hypothetical protein